MQWYVYLIMIPAAFFLGQIAIELLGQPIQAILRLRQQALERLLAFRDVTLPMPRETAVSSQQIREHDWAARNVRQAQLTFGDLGARTRGLERNGTYRLRPDDSLWPRHRACRPCADQPLANLCGDEMRQRRGASGHRRRTSRGQLGAHRFSPAFRWRPADEDSARADVSARYAFTPTATAARAAPRGCSSRRSAIQAWVEAFGTIRQIEVCFKLRFIPKSAPERAPAAIRRSGSRLAPHP